MDNKDTRVTTERSPTTSRRAGAAAQLEHHVDRAAGLDVVELERLVVRELLARVDQIRRIWSTWMPSFSWSCRLICKTSSVGSKVMACLRPVSVLTVSCIARSRAERGAGKRGGCARLSKRRVE